MSLFPRLARSTEYIYVHGKFMSADICQNSTCAKTRRLFYSFFFCWSLEAQRHWTRISSIFTFRLPFLHCWCFKPYQVTNHIFYGSWKYANRKMHKYTNTQKHTKTQIYKYTNKKWLKDPKYVIRISNINIVIREAVIREKKIFCEITS